MTVTPHHLTFIFNSFNICPFCQTIEKLKEIKTAKVCVIWNSNSFHSSSFKLCTLITQALTMCTYYFEQISVHMSATRVKTRLWSSKTFVVYFLFIFSSCYCCPKLDLVRWTSFKYYFACNTSLDVTTGNWEKVRSPPILSRF
jgi:hypothetical protein